MSSQLLSSVFEIAAYMAILELSPNLLPGGLLHPMLTKKGYMKMIQRSGSGTNITAQNKKVEGFWTTKDAPLSNHLPTIIQVLEQGVYLTNAQAAEEMSQDMLIAVVSILGDTVARSHDPV